MRTRLWRSATARLVLATLALQVLAVAAVLGVLWTQTAAALEGERRDRIVAIRDDAMASYYDGGLASLARFVDERLHDRGDPGLILSLSRAGRPLAGNVAQVPGPPRGFGQAELLETDARRPTRALITARLLPDDAMLLVGHNVTGDQRLRRAFEEGLAVAIAAALVFAVLVAAAAGRIVSRRTRTIAATARRLGAGEFDARIAEDGSGDGFDALRREINGMAGRIERLVAELRLVTDGLAHDLRTPVTRMKAALARGPDAGTLAAVQAEADTLDAMLTTALDITRVEAGVGHRRQATHDLRVIAAEIEEVYESLAEDSGATIRTVPGDAPVVAAVDRQLILRALSNLVDNALKYGARTITLSVTEDGETIALAVADDGPGIAAADRAEALRRFGRLDTARRAPGAGLGLSLVTAIAHAHGGTLSLHDNAPGLRAIVTLSRGH